MNSSSNATYGSGYIETNALLTRSAAAKAAKEYTTLPAKSDKCTGWFLPTAGQYYVIMTGLGTGLSPSNWSIDNFFSSSCMNIVSDKINNALKKAGTNNYTEFCLGGSNISEWASTNYNAGNAINIDPGYNNDNTYKSFRFQAYPKTAGLSVRPFLAF